MAHKRRGRIDKMYVKADLIYKHKDLIHVSSAELP